MTLAAIPAETRRARAIEMRAWADNAERKLLSFLPRDGTAIEVAGPATMATIRRIQARGPDQIWTTGDRYGGTAKLGDAGKILCERLLLPERPRAAVP